MKITDEMLTAMKNVRLSSRHRSAKELLFESDFTELLESALSVAASKDTPVSSLGGWHSHDGMLDPDIPGDTLVQVCFRDGDIAFGIVHDWDQNWQWADTEEGVKAPGAIVAWRPHPAPVSNVGGVDIPRLPIGTFVEKVGGYPFPGVIVASFHTTDGNERFVVEATGEAYAGMLHIFNGGQLRAALSDTATEAGQ